MRLLSLITIVAVSRLACQTRAPEFKCPEGTQDSGVRPGMIVRWCQDARLLYHGPVWRWYRNGQIESRENYVHGSMEGEIPSWYENGTRSSLGSFKDGNKIGTWRYWDDSAHLITQVNYTPQRNALTTYYPSGRKRAVGAFIDGAKVGLWIYWSSDGAERARCDFANGLFALPDRSCRVIADSLEPVGFSQPLATAEVVSDKATVHIGTEAYELLAPAGWVADTGARFAEERIPLVLYLKGRAWRGQGPKIYFRVLFKDGRSFQKTVDDERLSFRESVAAYESLPLRDGQLLNGIRNVSTSISYQVTTPTDSPFEIVAHDTTFEVTTFLDVSSRVVFLGVLTSTNRTERESNTPVFTSLLNSVHDAGAASVIRQRH